jgi:hypothetical protein
MLTYKDCWLIDDALQRVNCTLIAADMGSTWDKISILCQYKNVMFAIINAPAFADAIQSAIDMCHQIDSFLVDVEAE